MRIVCQLGTESNITNTNTKQHVHVRMNESNRSRNQRWWYKTQFDTCNEIIDEIALLTTNRKLFACAQNIPKIENENSCNRNELLPLMSGGGTWILAHHCFASNKIVSQATNAEEEWTARLAFLVISNVRYSNPNTSGENS